MLRQSSVMQVQMQVRVLRPLSVIQVEAQSAVSVVGVVERCVGCYARRMVVIVITIPSQSSYSSVFNVRGRKRDQLVSFRSARRQGE